MAISILDPLKDRQGGIRKSVDWYRKTVADLGDRIFGNSSRDSQYNGKTTYIQSLGVDRISVFGDIITMARGSTDLRGAHSTDTNSFTASSTTAHISSVNDLHLFSPSQFFSGSLNRFVCMAGASQAETAIFGYAGSGISIANGGIPVGHTSTSAGSAFIMSTGTAGIFTIANRQTANFSDTITQFQINQQDTNFYTDNVIINGSGLNNLNSIIYRSKTNVEVTPSSFTSTSGQAIVSISGLATGIHDVIVTKSGVSFTGSNFVEIQDSVSHGYAFENHVSSGFRYVQEKPTSEELATALSGESFEFSTTEESDRVQVTFSGGVITGGNVTFNLSKKSIVSKNVTNEYTVKGFGLNASDSETEAFNKFNSGIYSEDQYGDYSSEFSYSLDSRVCSITGESTNTTNQESTFTSTGTYTGQVAGDPLSLPLIAALRSANQASYESYTGTQNLGCSVISSTGVTSGVIGSASTGEAVSISATSFDPAQNLASINSQISNTGVYSGYVLLSTSTGISDNFESVSYSSGISFPFATSQLEDTTSQIWHNVFNSGIDLLYPSGWTGQHSLTSGFAVITGSATGSSTFTFSGKSIDAVNSLISGEIQNNRKYCTTGDPSYFNTGEIVNLTETGYFYGYC